MDCADASVVRGKEDLLPVRTVEVDEEAPIRIRVHVERVARREHVVGIECPDPHHALRERKRGRKRLLAPVRAVLAPDAAEASILSENPDVVVADPGDVDHFDGRRLVGRVGPDAARTDEQSRCVDVLAGGVDGAVRRHPDATHGLRNERSARKRFVGPGPVPVPDGTLGVGRDRHVDVVRGRTRDAANELDVVAVDLERVEGRVSSPAGAVQVDGRTSPTATFSALASAARRRRSRSPFATGTAGARRGRSALTATSRRGGRGRRASATIAARSGRRGTGATTTFITAAAGVGRGGGTSRRATSRRRRGGVGVAVRGVITAPEGRSAQEHRGEHGHDRPGRPPKTHAVHDASALQLSFERASASGTARKTDHTALSSRYLIRLLIS